MMKFIPTSRKGMHVQSSMDFGLKMSFKNIKSGVFFFFFGIRHRRDCMTFRRLALMRCSWVTDISPDIDRRDARVVCRYHATKYGIVQREKTEHLENLVP